MKRITTAVILSALLLGFWAEASENHWLDLRNGSDHVDLVGDTVVIGTTWNDLQHVGSIGRMVTQSDNGYLHFCWANTTPSHCVIYNYIDPFGQQGWPGTGIPVEMSASGSPTLDVMNDGRAVIAYNRNHPFERDNTAVAVDFYPHTGAFQVFEPDYQEDLTILWPHVQLDRQGLIRIVSTENPASGIPGVPQRHFYTHGVYDSLNYTVSFPQTPDTWTEMSYTMTHASDLATSSVSDRVAFAWTYCREEGFPDPDSTYATLNNDIWLLIDDDGQDLHFEDAFNLTQFIPPELWWLPDTLMANRDTFRTYTDLSLFFDQNDWVHIAFTTVPYYAIQGTTYEPPSIIWHWTDQWLEFFMIHNGFAEWSGEFIDCGAWNVMAQRPSLGQDPETGFLYCAYQVYDCDTSALSAAGYASGDVYVSVSGDDGIDWSVGTNVTETVTPDQAAPGQCLSEVCPSMAKLVDDTCHIMYVLDRDAGSAAGGEGTWTLNDVIYHKVPMDSVPMTPYVEQNVLFHVGYVPVTPLTSMQAATFVLGRPYPNPFNPTTILSYTLQQASTVRLAVYDVAGREVAVLADGWARCGHHEVVFDGSDLASGLYIYRLQADDFKASGKMVLMK